MRLLDHDCNKEEADGYVDFEDLERYRPGTLKAYRDWWTVRAAILDSEKHES